jgi:hypothetical protein
MKVSMNKWTRFQDRITSLRAPAGAMLAFFLCIASVSFVLIGPNLRMYYTYQTKGLITGFEPFAEDGIAEHHFQSVDLYGTMRYDVPMDIIGEHNHVILRTVILEDEETHYALLINNHKMYSVRDAAMTNIYGVVRRMDKNTHAQLMELYGDEIAQWQAQGWTVETDYYINELETLTDPEKMRGILIYAGVNILLIFLCLVPFIVPHPRTIHKQAKAEMK